jgi:hypothetical protein
MPTSTPTSASYTPLAALPDAVRAVLEPDFSTVLDALAAAGRAARDPHARERFARLLACVCAAPDLPPGIEFAMSGEQFHEQWNGTVLARWNPDGWAMLRWSKINTHGYDLRGHPCAQVDDDGVVTYVQVAEHGRRLGIATALLACACAEAGSMLGGTLATDAGAEWGPQARDRLAGARLAAEQLPALADALRAAARAEDGPPPPGCRRAGFHDVAQRLDAAIEAHNQTIDTARVYWLWSIGPRGKAHLANNGATGALCGVEPHGMTFTSSSDRVTIEQVMPEVICKRCLSAEAAQAGGRR